MKPTTILAAVTANLALASGSILWDGRFNNLTTSSLLTWSWSNQVEPYQYYIHGPSEITSYISLSPNHKNPADTGSNQGIRITLDDTAYWNGQTMRRTELIPQTSAAIATGRVWYHFSLMRKNTNPPAAGHEHQIAFFESHFTELKAGISGAVSDSSLLLHWYVGGSSKWNTVWDADVWHNVAYEIDFSQSTVGFWHSIGSDDLSLVAAPINAATSSNGADWHLGVLELPGSGYEDGDEDIFFSGVYVEDEELTTDVAGPGGSSGGDSFSSSSTLSTTTTTTTTTATSSSSSSTTTNPTGCIVSMWAQCGGNNWNGCTVCEPGAVCTISNAWYSQCLSV